MGSFGSVENCHPKCPGVRLVGCAARRRADLARRPHQTSAGGTHLGRVRTARRSLHRVGDLGEHRCPIRCVEPRCLHRSPAGVDDPGSGRHRGCSPPGGALPEDPARSRGRRTGVLVRARLAHGGVSPPRSGNRGRAAAGAHRRCLFDRCARRCRRLAHAGHTRCGPEDPRVGEAVPREPGPLRSHRCTARRCGVRRLAPHAANARQPVSRNVVRAVRGGSHRGDARPARRGGRRPHRRGNPRPDRQRTSPPCPLAARRRPQRGPPRFAADLFRQGHPDPNRGRASATSTIAYGCANSTT